MSARRAMLTVAIAGALAALAGCGAAQDRSGPGAPPGPILSLILGRERLAADNEIAAAQQILFARCLRAHSFPSYPEGVASTLPQLGPADDVAVSFGSLADVPPEFAALYAARSWGFGLSTQSIMPQPAQVPPALQYERSLSGANARLFQEVAFGPASDAGTFSVPGIALHGYRSGGCVGYSEGALYGSPRIANEATYVPEDLAFAALHQTDTSASFIAAQERWSRCLLRSTGIDANTPGDVAANVATRERERSPITLQQAQEAVAVADTRCLYSSGLLSTDVASMRRFASRLAGPQEGLLLQLVEATAHADRLARRVLASEAVG